jgi:hypothetical protein
MFVLSPLSANALAQYPVTLASSYITRALTFVNSTEQRWVVKGPLFAATLSYRSINGFDLGVLKSFFDQMGGSYVDPALINVFSFTILGNTYNYCVFDQDAFGKVVSRGETFSTELRIKQIRPN